MVAWYLTAAAGAAALLVMTFLLRQRKWRDSMILSILGWLFVAAVVFVGTSAVLLWLLGWPSLPRAAEFTTTETLDLLKIALAVVAGFGGVVILSVNHRRQRFTEKDHELARNQDDREQTKLFNERFAAAAEHLAHDRAQVRLAGVYALAELADDWAAGRQKCVDVLIAYLRLAQSEDRYPGAGEEEVVKTIFRTFRERPWSNLDYDFTGMTLEDFDLSDMHFDGDVVFDKVTFTGELTSFHRAQFTGRFRADGARFHATTTSFNGATFGLRADFRQCLFSDTADFEGLEITGVGTTFEECGFESAVSFDFLNLSDASLSFRKCEFTGPRASFDAASIGPYSWDNPLRVLLDAAKPITVNPRLSFQDCLVNNCELSVDDGYAERGRVSFFHIVLQGSTLRVNNTAAGPPSLYLRAIEATDSVVDVPDTRE